MTDVAVTAFCNVRYDAGVLVASLHFLVSCRVVKVEAANRTAVYHGRDSGRVSINLSSKIGKSDGFGGEGD